MIRHLKLVLLAILLIGLVLANAQLEANDASLVEQDNSLIANEELELADHELDKRGRGGKGGNDDDEDDDNNGGNAGSSSTSGRSPCVAPTRRPSSSSSSSSSTGRPTSAPTSRPPTSAPTRAPTSRPPAAGTSRPAATAAPTRAPTSRPATVAPTRAPTARPATVAPTRAPTSAPSTSGSSTVGLCDIVPTSQEPLKFLVPLYVYPSSGKWDPVAEAAKKIPTIAIVNPNNGPTATPSSDYASGMTKLKAANAEMIGYVYTSYGDRSVSDVKKDIDTWKAKWPAITGIFFDEASNNAADIPYYRELYNYVIGKGYKHSILNPGTQPDQGYVAISTNIVVFETYGNKWASKSFPSFVKCAPNAAAKAGYKYKFSGIAHSVSGNTASTALIKEMEKAGLGMVYITDGTPETSVYNPLPSYFTSQVSDIQKINTQ